MRTLLRVAGVAVALGFLLFAGFSWRERAYVLDWYWHQARVLGYPRLLDGVWADGLAGYTPAAWHSILRPFATLAVVWASAVFLLRLVAAALRRGFGADGAALLPWPKPKPRSPLGIPANALIVVGWGWLPAGFLLALPPVVGPAGYSVSSAEAFTRVWSALRWLPYPQVLDARAARLSAAALERSALWSVRQPVDLSVKFNRPLVELVALELATIGLGVALALSAVWVWQAWRGAARGGGAGAYPLEAGPRRASPGWAVVFLPLTFPLALVGLGVWKSPLWLPKLALKGALLYLAGAAALFVLLSVGAARNAETNLEAMRWLGPWWFRLEDHLFVAERFHARWIAIPHRSRDAIGDADVLHAVVLISAVGAAALVPLAVAARLTLAALKRTLEALAR